MGESVESFRRSYTSEEIASVKEELRSAAHHFERVSQWSHFFQDYKRVEMTLMAKIIRANLIYRDGEASPSDKSSLLETITWAEAALKDLSS